MKGDAVIDSIHRYAMPAALSLLPPTMDTPAARAMLLAIGLQESRFERRRQMRNGPARGFWQFESMGGVFGVLTHPQTRHHAESVLCALRYDSILPLPSTVHAAIEHNDVLACALARLLLWTVPGPLPARTESVESWNYYLEGWRPGKPHADHWADNWTRAWEIVTSS